MARVELRHLRYFIAVAEAGSFSLAAQTRLRTAQPSLSRQIRELEREVGTKLLERKARGVELTAAGRVFLDHARLVLLQVDAARDAALRVTRPEKKSFVLGFLTGQEMIWLPAALSILQDIMPTTELMVLSQSSPELTADLLRGTVDAAFLRKDERAPGLVYRLVAREPLVVLMARDHPLAARRAIAPKDLAREPLIRPSRVAPALNAVIDAYAERNGIRLKTANEVDDLAMAISLLASTRSVGLVSKYAESLLPPTVVARPLQGHAPAMELYLGYNKSNRSSVLKRLLSEVDELVARVSPTL
jgi:LysR family transcriptional regulator, hca operon transcriptional activator